MRTSVNLPDEVIERVRVRADEEGISLAEWMRRAIITATTPRPADEHPDEHPDVHPAGTPEHPATPHEIDALTARISELERDIEQYRVEAVTARENAENATADRDALTARIAILDDQARTAAAEVTRAREEIEARDQRLIEKADEIRWLRGEVSKLNDKLTPAALPETAGPGRRPWPLGWLDEIRGRDPIRRS